jgi:2-methylcitrate dehydratase
MIEVQRMAGVFGLDIDQAAMGQVTDWKHCMYASCALRGMHIARMALAGFEGAKEVYEGEAGVNQFFPHRDTMLEPLPDLSNIVFKRWPALVFCQTPIDVALDLAGEISEPQKITSIEVKSFQEAIKNGATASAWNPASRAGRTHSIPYCVAACLIKKRMQYSYFDDDFAENENELAVIMSKVSVVEDPDMTAQYPSGAPCRITVTMMDGTSISKIRDYPKGDPRDPLSDIELEDKALDYLSCVMNLRSSKLVIERIWNIENEENVSWLVSPLKQKLV